MDFYWVYDYPTWVLFVGFISVFMVFSVSGIFILRSGTDRFFKLSIEDNEIVAQFLGVTGVFFGLVLGMVAVGAWDSYKNAELTVVNEATKVGKLYRSVDLLEDPLSPQIKVELRNYTKAVVDKEWPKQQQGLIPDDTDQPLAAMGKLIFQIPIDDDRSTVVVNAVVEQYFELVEARRQRFESVYISHLPGGLWWVMVASTVIIIGLSMLMHIPNRKLDIAINVLMSVLTGSILAFIVAMDNPYRGELSVPAQAFQLLLDDLMVEGPAAAIP